MKLTFFVVCFMVPFAYALDESPPSQVFTDYLTVPPDEATEDQIKEAKAIMHETRFKYYFPEEAAELNGPPSGYFTDYLTVPYEEATDDQKREAIHAMHEAQTRYYNPERMVELEARKHESNFKKMKRGLKSGSKKFGKFVEEQKGKYKRYQQKRKDNKEWERLQKERANRAKEEARRQKAAAREAEEHQYQKWLDKDAERWDREHNFSD